MATWQRTHTCGDLRDTHVGQNVVLNGWVNSFRAYPDQIFVDLRDRYGITQVVIEIERPELFTPAQEVRTEWVLSVRGTVRERLPGKHNPKLLTGDIELVAEDVQVLKLQPGDRFLLATDGLTGVVSDERLAEVLRSCEDPQRAAQTLVDDALANLSKDNITCVVIHANAA